MAPKLYGCKASPCSRAVEMFAEAIGLQLEVEYFILSDGDYLRSDLPKINPKRTIPTLDDDGFYLWDSHAIMIYLMERYGKTSSLYPKDVQKRALVNQILFFDCGDLFARYVTVVNRLLFRGGTSELTEKDIKFVAENYDMVERFLQGGKFIAGNEVTIADISIWCTITNSSTYSPLDLKKYPNIRAWFGRMEALPYAHINIEGRKEIEKLFAKFLNK